MEMTKMTATDLTTQSQKSLAPRILRQVSLRGMMNANPAPPGSYYLGEADADGLVVVANPLTRIVLAVGAESCGLIALGHTAAATALGLPGNRMGLVVVTERPDHWPASVPGVQVFMPEQFGELVSRLMVWHSGDLRLLVILDDISAAWELVAADIQTLTHNPAASVLILTRPDFGAVCQEKLPSEYVVQEAGGNPYKVKFLVTAYGQGSQQMAPLPGISDSLGYGQFAARIQSRWIAFTAANQE
jgi:hypothetical protein